MRTRLRSWFTPSSAETEYVSAAPAVAIKEIYRRFWPYARPYRGWLLLGLIPILVIPAIETVEIALFQRVVDDVLVPGDLRAFVGIALTYVGLSLGSAGVSFLDDYLYTWIAGRFLVDLRTSLFRHVLSLSLDFHDRRRLGDVLTRLTSDPATIEGFMLSGMADALSAVARIVFFVGALVWIDWQLALVSLLVAPLFWMATRRLMSLVKELSRERRRLAGSRTAVAEETLANGALVVAYNRQQVQVSRFQRENEAIARSQLASSRVDALFGPLIDLAELCGLLVVIALGAWALAGGRVTLGGLLAFLTYLTQLYRPIRDLSGLATSLYSASAGAERIIELLDERPPFEDRPDAIELGRAAGLVEFDAVSLRYPQAEGSAVEDLTLRVEPGQVVALVGASGAGKSSIAKLTVRLLDPTAGTVRLDGHDLRDLRVASVRENVSILFQEPLTLDATVAENIAFGRPDAAGDEIVAAAEAADAHEFIMALPAGYDTRVGQKGRTLSGGQRQRVAVARALLRDAPVLVLDEPTAALDGAAARRVIDPLRRLMRDRTTILISHDVGVVASADEIVVLDGGRVVEQGSHADLLALGGHYARLWRLREGPATADSPMGALS